MLRAQLPRNQKKAHCYFISIHAAPEQGKPLEQLVECHDDVSVFSLHYRADICMTVVTVTIRQIKPCSQADANAQCASVDPHGGQVQSCLRDHRLILNWDCQEQLFRQQVENADDMRLSMRLFKACLADKKQVGYLHSPQRQISILYRQLLSVLEDRREPSIVAIL